MTESCNQNIRVPSKEIVENSLWIYPDQELIKKSNHIILLIAGRDSSGFERWTWSYVAQMPHDGFIPAIINLPYKNTGDLNYSGKFIPIAIELMHNRYPNHKISIVAHSMGNLVAAWAMHYRPTFMAKYVKVYVAMGAPFQGVKNAVANLGKQPVIYQVDSRSKFIKEINSSPFPKPIRYLSIISETDEIATLQDPKYVASFPHGTVGEVKTPQEVFNTKNKISHLEELVDNGIYEMVKAFLNDVPVIIDSSADMQYYPYLQKEGFDWAFKYGRKRSDLGDAPDVTQEPPLLDEVI